MLSLQSDRTIIERLRVRCTLSDFTVYQTGTNFMVNKKPYNLCNIFTNSYMFSLLANTGCP